MIATGSRATIVFSEIQGYEVHEAPFHGSPTILDYEVLGENANRVEIKLLTNAGYRRFSFESVDIQWPQKNKNLVEEQFFSGERDALVKFVLNDAVQIKNGEHAGELGSVVGQVVEPEMLSYVVELANGQGDVTLHQASLVLVGAADEKT